MGLQEMYNNLCNTPSDINEHLPILNKYAQKCSHITEMGFRCGVSTYAFLAAKPNKLFSYDINYHESVEQVKKIAKTEGIDFEFIHADVLKIDIEQTDFLFIDTWHTEMQLSKELELHSKKVKKYIGLHDTHTFGQMGEDGVPGHGLNYAIISFIKNNPSWKEIYKTIINNGLTILEKQND